MGNPAKIAVRTLTMGVPHGCCFGMLGPNGAGKTTTINMLGLCAVFLCLSCPFLYVVWIKLCIPHGFIEYTFASWIHRTNIWNSGDRRV
jgi:hypothetical protein